MNARNTFPCSLRAVTTRRPLALLISLTLGSLSMQALAEEIPWW